MVRMAQILRESGLHPLQLDGRTGTQGAIGGDGGRRSGTDSRHGDRRLRHPRRDARRLRGTFLPPANGELAEAKFWGMQQEPDESIQRVHARTRVAFVRAFPGVNIDGDMGRTARKVFIRCLSNRKVADFVAENRPTTFKECLDLAQAKEAAIKIMEPPGKTQARLHAMPDNPAPRPVTATQANPGGLRCSNCYAADHLWRDCNIMKELREARRRNGDLPPLGTNGGMSAMPARNGNNNNRNRTANRTAGRSTGRPGGNNSRPTRRVQAIQGEAEDPDDGPSGNDPGRA